ncbi:hypothetical protein BHM03_00046957 [Ensete ventricosum]|nr:hypothetical protein BHM03_00046957 [Ensete ventricosum]
MVANPTLRHGGRAYPLSSPSAPLFLSSPWRTSLLIASSRVCPFSPFSRSFSSFPSLGWKRRRSRVGGSLESVPCEVGGSADDGAGTVSNKVSVEIPFGNRRVITYLKCHPLCFLPTFCMFCLNMAEFRKFQILVETGHIGRQASASVTVTDGETVSPVMSYFNNDVTLFLKNIRHSVKVASSNAIKYELFPPFPHF